MKDHCQCPKKIACAGVQTKAYGLGPGHPRLALVLNTGCETLDETNNGLKQCAFEQITMMSDRVRKEKLIELNIRLPEP